MSERTVTFVQCPSPKCESCNSISRPYATCQILRKNDECGHRVILLDKESKQLHLRGIIDNDTQVLDSRIWKTIYIGSETDIFGNINAIEDAYCIGPYIAFFYFSEENTLTYIAIPNIHTSLEYGLLESLMDDMQKITGNLMKKRRGIDYRLEEIARILDEYLLQDLPEISSFYRRRIVEIASHKTSVLYQLIPMLLDERIEELYLDKPDGKVYFDHQKYGRCKTNVKLGGYDITRLITLLRAESNLHLDRKNPSLKTDVRLLGVSLRIAVSLPPLAADGFHMEIRRAKTRPFTLYDLIRNGTLTEEIAAALLFALYQRFNITITGPPGAGKTTLLNALDLQTPKEWRKIYIEDALESRLNPNHNQVRVRVDPIDETNASSNKSVEIVKSLHKSPDYLILGEIQTAEHSQALFQAIGAGIRTLQTCHSSSASSLVSRWKASHNIEDQSIALMDIIVVLERPEPGKSYRRVTEISEIRRSSENGITTFFGLNKIFDKNGIENTCNDWPTDGAYQSRIKECSIAYPMERYNEILLEIRKELANEESEMYFTPQSSSIA